MIFHSYVAVYQRVRYVMGTITVLEPSKREPLVPRSGRSWVLQKRYNDFAQLHDELKQSKRHGKLGRTPGSRLVVSKVYKILRYGQIW